MSIKQISVFMENRPGRLAEITRVLAKNNIDMRAINIADTTDFGILRMIVSEPDRAEKVLRDNDMTASITDVIAISIDDKSVRSVMLCLFWSRVISVLSIYTHS